MGSTYNYAAGLYLSLIKAFRSGDMETARELQLKSQKLVLLIYKYPSAGKQFMELIGQPVGPQRPPLVNCFERNDELRANLKKIDVLPYLGDGKVQFK
ncbi:MAG: dihydrodipicolinate synthase family protein [Victivallales bacterium]|nr:dihydrodipicolinate synthase family protein [Victivallales bacterium]